MTVGIGLFWTLVLGLASCASSPGNSGGERSPLYERLERVSCPSSGDLRGIGISDRYESALSLAQTQLASKISASVSSSNTSLKKQRVDASGKESVESSFRMETNVSTHLENAQDVVIAESISENGLVGVVACLSRADAAKPFVLKERALADSFLLSIAEFRHQTHPLRKQAAYRDAESLFYRELSNRDLLKDFGISPDASDPSPEYETLRREYGEFRSRYAFHLDHPPSGDLENRLFARLSAAYPVQVGSCSEGVRLSLSSGPVSCGESAFGFSCSVNVALTGASCGGESYFTLNAAVNGIGRYDRDEAMKKLKTQIADAAYFEEWKKELNKWSLK